MSNIYNKEINGGRILHDVSPGDIFSVERPELLQPNFTEFMYLLIQCFWPMTI